MAGIVDVATGGDQGGSVRIPSAYSGTVGHKPTWGLVPYTGAFPIEATIDHVGPITRTVADAALVLNVIAGPDGHDPRQPRDLVPDDYLAALARDAVRPARRRRHRGLRPPQLRGGRRRHRAGRHRDAARGGPGRRGRLDPVAQPRRPDLGRDRHRGRGQPDGRPQRLRAELEGPLRPGGHRALRQPVARRRHEVLRDRQVRAAHRGFGGRAAPRQALRDGAEPRLRAAPGLRRGAVALRRAGDAHAADAGHRHPGARRPARRDPPARAGDDRQHVRHRRDRAPGLLGARRASRTGCPPG